MAVMAAAYCAKLTDQSNVRLATLPRADEADMASADVTVERVELGGGRGLRLLYCDVSLVLRCV